MEPGAILESIRSLPLRQRCVVALPARQRLRAQGPDALRFLNGQTSNQIANATASKAIPTCVLTIKGKIVSVPLCWRGEGEDEFFLEVPEESGEATRQRLDRYLIADELELTMAPAPATWHLPGGIWRDRVPPGARAVDRFGLPGWDVDTEEPPGQGEGDGKILTVEEAEMLRIVNTVPGPAEFDAGVFPAEVGLDRQAVDFQKGCYLGQEVVSRLESVGKARRTLVSWLAGATPPEGAELAAAPGERSLGCITTVLKNVGDGAAGLAIVREELAAATSPLHAFAADGSHASVRLLSKSIIVS